MALISAAPVATPLTSLPTAGSAVVNISVGSPLGLVVGSTVLILVALAHQSIRINRLRAIDAARTEEG